MLNSVRQGMLWITVFAAGMGFAGTKFEIAANHGDCTYAVGETATFTVLVTNDSGTPLSSGTVNWSLDNYGSEMVHAKTAVNLANGNPFQVSGALAYPGFLRLNLETSDSSSKRCWSVAVAPTAVTPGAACPADFDSFWTAAKANLASNVPLDAQMTFVASKSTGSFNYYKVSFATYNNQRVYGFYTEPKDTSKKYPVRVMVPGAGPYHNSSWLGNGSSVTLMMNVFPFEPSDDNDQFTADYNAWNSQMMSTYGVQSSYACAGIAVSREQYVFYPALLGINRAVDWLLARPLADTTRVAYCGGSQGGAFGFMLMGLNGGFTRGAMYVPAMCDHLGADVNRAPGWPNLIGNQTAANRAAARANAPYFDAVNFARTITVPVRCVVGLSDVTCPPAGGWCAFNALASTDKYMVSVPGMTHSVDSAIESDLASWAMGTESAQPNHPEADGTTFVINDKILTITVPAGVTNSYNYASMTVGGAVTNIVVTGQGSLNLASLPDYDGDFTITGAAVARVNKANAFGRNALTLALGCGTVRVTSGAAIFATGGSAGNVKGKRFIVAGTGPDGKGALIDGVNAAIVQCSRFTLAGDTTLLAWQTGSAFTWGNEFDVAGHKLSFTARNSWNEQYFSGNTFTNSSPTAATVEFLANSYNYRFQGDPDRYVGGSQNEVVFTGNYHYRLERPLEGDWTLKLGSCRFCYGRNTKNSDIHPGWTNNACCLPVVVQSGTTVRLSDDSYNPMGHAMTFAHSLSGSGNLSVARGDTFHLATTACDYAGILTLMPPTNANLRTTLMLMKNAAFTASYIKIAAPDKSIYGQATANCPYTGCDILMDAETVFALPGITNTIACPLTISGGAAGTTIAGIEKTNSGVLTLDTTATIGTLHMTGGSLVIPSTLAVAPRVETLNCASGVTADLGGKTLHVGTILGMPQVVNGSIRCEAEGWDGDVLVSDPMVGKIDDGTSRIFVFTNPAAGPVAMMLAKPFVLERYLVVGGGGAGGWLGGGGGAGGFFTNAAARVLVPSTVSITVGAGGATQGSSGNWLRGKKGGDSSVRVADLEVLARGGQGGGGWSSNDGALDMGDFGSGGGTANNKSATLPSGVTLQGYQGSRSNGSTYMNAGGGGGGGAGGAAIKGNDEKAGSGGPGVTCDILGSEREFCAGGGGGSVNNCLVGGDAGGVTAGAGGSKNTAATAATPCSGSGGGGGSYSPAKSPTAGASGIVVLRLAPCAKGVLSVGNAAGTLPGTLSVAAGGYALDDGATMTCGASDAVDPVTGVGSVCTGYTLETWNEEGASWSAPVAYSGHTYNHTQSGTTCTRLTWQWQEGMNYTHADGTRFVVENHVLTVTVPAGVTNDFNYSAAVGLLNVTNIVLVGPATGSGALKARAVADYEGDFTVGAGVDFQIACNSAFGKNYASVAACPSTVRILNGGQITTLSGLAANGITGRLILFEGLGTSGKAAIWQGNAANNGFSKCLFRLTGDATTWQTGGGSNTLYYNGDNVFDVNGHELVENTSATWAEFAFSKTTWTNSNATAGSFVFKPNSMNHAFKYAPFYFWGGPQNTVVFQGGYCYRIREPIYGDWTLELKNCFITSATGHDPYPAEIGIGWTNNVITLPLKVTGHAKFWDDSYKCEGGATTVAGPISGDGTMSVARGDVLHMASPANTFSGNFYLYAGTNVNHHTTLVLLKGSVFSAAQILTGADPQNKVRDTINPYTHCDILMDGETVFHLPTVKNELNRCGLVIAGGAEGTTVGAVTHKTTGALVLDTPAIITSVTLTKGSLLVTNDVTAVGVTPSILALSCPDGTTVDLGGNDLVVGSLTGNPTVVNGTLTVGGATWAKPSVGGAWGTAANWESNRKPAAGGAMVVFPKAQAADVPVTVNENATLLSFQMGVGATAADGFAQTGYSLTGTGVLTPFVNEFVFDVLSGVNTIASPLAGDKDVQFNVAFQPQTNSAAACHAALTVTESALAGLTGQVTVNANGGYLDGKVTLGTGSFGGSLKVVGGSAIVDSLAFVQSPDDLTLAGGGTLVYGGPAATIPGLTFSAANGAAIETTNDLAVQAFVETRTDRPLFKHGPGALRILGNESFTLTGNERIIGSYGYDGWGPVDGYGIQGKYCGALNVTDGAVVIGVKGDTANAPTVVLNGHNSANVNCALFLGSGNNYTRNPKFVVDNGTVTVNGDLSMNNWNQAEEEGTTKTVEVNGGSLTIDRVNNRLGWQWWPRSAHVYTVNGGVFTVKTDFNLTELSPRDYAAVGSAEQLRLRASAARRCSVNGGTMTAGTFKMGYSFGRGWNYEASPVLSNGNGYGHGWQADAYLTVNGGTLAVTNYLLTTDRADSRSWTVLNGGTLKVNMVTNTIGRTADTYLVLNGGMFAPMGDGDNPDELVLRNLFKSAVVSTNGAVFSTAFFPADKTYTIEQPLTHDPLCGGAADGGLVKKGEGTLRLASEANTFTGPIAVDGGTLAFANGRTLPSREMDVYLAETAKLHVDAGSVSVRSLTINGQPLGSGSYGSSSSHASKKDNAHFSGPGIVMVGTPSTLLIFR